MPKTRPRSRTPKVSGGLKGFSDARKVNNELLKDIQTHIVSEAIKHEVTDREQHKIHVSELTKKDVCPRNLWYKLNNTERTDPPDRINHRSEMVYAAGHDAHARWQRWLQETTDLAGTWNCLHCGHTWEVVSPHECEMCQSPALEYKELSLEDEEYRLVGHADGAVPSKGALVEVKTFATGHVRMDNPELVQRYTVKTAEGKTVVDADGLWKSLNRPLRAHLLQAMLYLWLCQRMGYTQYDKLIFIYEYKVTQATKTFEVTLSDRIIAPAIAMLKNVARATSPPRRPVLFAKESQPCKSCLFRTKCWEKDDDDQESTTVPARRPRSRSQAPDRASAVPSASPTRAEVPGDTERPNRFRRPRSPRSDDRTNPVGRAPVRATGVRRGGREVGTGSDGEGEGSRFSRKGPRRDRAESESV